MWEALEIHDSLAENILDKTIVGTVHSVFERAINIETEFGLFSVLSGSIDRAPTSLFVEKINFKKLKIKTKTDIRIENNILAIDNYKINLKNAGIYKLVLPKLNPDNVKLIQNIEFLKVSLDDKEFFKTETINTLIDDIINKRLDELYDLFIDNKPFEAKLHSLIGLGSGLTPTGDDIIVGLMAVYSVFDIKIFNRIKGMLLKENYETTDVSRAVLINATNNYFRQSIVNLISNIQNTIIDKEDLETILSIGHSSGFDILRGVLLGLRSHYNC